jgi:hypothetical protein
LIHFTVVCCILWTFGIVRGNLVYFYRFYETVSAENIPAETSKIIILLLEVNAK